MSEGTWDAFYQTLLAVVIGAIIGFVHNALYGYLAFICLQLTAILGCISGGSND